MGAPQAEYNCSRSSGNHQTQLRFFILWVDFRCGVHSVSTRSDPSIGRAALSGIFLFSNEPMSCQILNLKKIVCVNSSNLALNSIVIVGRWPDARISSYGIFGYSSIIEPDPVSFPNHESQFHEPTADGYPSGYKLKPRKVCYCTQCLVPQFWVQNKHWIEEPRRRGQIPNVFYRTCIRLNTGIKFVCVFW